MQAAADKSKNHLTTLCQCTKQMKALLSIQQLSKGQ
jgi:hypothetical protein